MHYQKGTKLRVINDISDDLPIGTIVVCLAKTTLLDEPAIIVTPGDAIKDWFTLFEIDVELVIDE